MDCCDVLDDALCRLQRKFLHAKRHEDDDHDPAQDRQQTIRPVSRFRDVEIILRVNHGVPWLSLRLMREIAFDVSHYASESWSLRTLSSSFDHKDVQQTALASRCAKSDVRRPL